MTAPHLLLLVRHAEATGQEPDAQLTSAGQIEADRLSQFIASNYRVSRIFCSPFVRASATVLPLARTTAIPILVDERLQEYYGPEEGGEEGGEEEAGEAVERVMEAIEDILSSSTGGVDVLVSHGALMAMALTALYPDRRLTADDLSRPDLYQLHSDTITRIEYA